MTNESSARGFSHRFAALSRDSLITAGIMSAVVSALLQALGGWTSFEFTAFNIPLVYALWVVDDMGYTLRQNPGTYAAVALGGGLVGIGLESVFY